MARAVACCSTRACARAARVSILFLLAGTGAPVAAAQDYLTLYAGKYTDESLGDVLVNKTIQFEHSFLGVVAWARALGDASRSYQWELELQVGKHAGVQTHWEFNALPVIRWKRLPWNHLLATTFAIGDGLSYATRVPPLELGSHTNIGANRLLNYVLVEMTVAPPRLKSVSFVARVHHRSGIYGLFNDVHGGSNIIAAGVKYAF